MGVFFVYIVKSSACLTLFYLFYKLLPGRDTFHRFNRIGLPGLVLVSVIIPFCRITLEEPVVMQPAVMDMETLLLMASLTGKAPAAATVPFWVRLLLWTYLSGLVFFFCQFLYSCVHTIRMIRRGRVSRLDDGIRLVITPEAVAPFSWMKYILVSPEDMEENGQAILTHERAHIRFRHSADLLIAEVCILFHWFNPAAWLLRQELQHIHEYEADESVLSEGIDARKYQLLLIKKAVGSQRFTSMANSFNHSSLKKRITMMLKRKSNPWARLKYLCVLPLAALAVVSFARPEIVHELDRISSVKFSEMKAVQEEIAEIAEVDKTKMAEVQKKVEEAMKQQEEVMKQQEEAMKQQEKVMKQQEEAMKQQKEVMDRQQVELKKNMAQMQEKTAVIQKVSNVLPSDLHILIDGKEATYAEMDALDPKQIESMTILKDNATETYGEKGKNGVIIITTKKEQ